MMRTKWFRRGVTLGLVAMLGLATQVPAHADEHVRFLLPTVKELPTFGPYVFAQTHGYYQAEGLDVEFLAGRGGVDVAKQVGAGNADIGEGLGDTSIIVRGNGIPVKTVALIGGGGLTQLIVPDSSGIEKLQDLRGKSIGVPTFQDTTFYALLGMLSTVGMTKADVDAQALGNGALVQMLLAGKIDACACVPDWVVAARDAGLKAHIFPAADYTPSMAQALIASDDMIEHHPETLRKIIRAVLKSFAGFRDHPVETAKLYALDMPTHKGEEAYLGRVYSYYAEKVYAGQTRPGAMDPEKLAKLQDLYLTEGVIRAKSPVEQLYTNELLPP
jgi:NitT/TauT family transport system substrate-binding protein